ncbi:TRAP-type C4-dicarboxylate transport system, small permease component [Desulfocicer vacuolatum DSM 3385]|uniref:TRAP-type C4-dicarboxylate transport system, small permease component n=1 Tax=Desulfocicer vacuolatum DSM 3385 TaxID=1121400 RepID=A0A1W2CR19_9BACT|nr:TRAP transporter small permease [Desulfocicer vacuolatum]SMC87416.1 TRAP-type C4-dicarboxylate transport system, small permease component [Desulfocicer vacuolatum DSM 3385]
MIRFFQTLSDGINRRVEALLFVMGGTMTLIVVVQVFSRYVLNHSLFWSEELARFLLVWLTFMGACVGYHKGVHPGVDVCFKRFSPRGQQWAMVGIHLASLLLFGVMVIKGISFAWFIRLQISPALSLPKWILMGIVPLAGVVLMIHGVRFLLEALHGQDLMD